MKHGWFYIAALLLMPGCVKEIPYAGVNNFAQTPVLHCFITPDSLIVADCRRTAPFGSKDAPEPNALFVLKHNTFGTDTASYAGNGLHTFAANPFKWEDSFVLSGSIAGGKTIAVKGVIPNAIQIVNIDTTRALIPGVGKAFAAAVRFTDNAAFDNFYRLFVYKKVIKYVYDYTGRLSDSFATKELISVYCNDLPAAENEYNSYTSREVLFTDQTFNGVKQNLLFYTTDPLLRSRKERPVALEFHLENISKSLFDFYNTRNAHIWQQQSISQLPGNIKGNIPETLGVIGAYSADVRKIELRR